MEASDVVCLPFRPPCPCHPENSWKYEGQHMKQSKQSVRCDVRCAVGSSIAEHMTGATTADWRGILFPDCSWILHSRCLPGVYKETFLPNV